MEHVLRLERLLQVVDEGAGEVAVDVVDAEALLDLLQALLSGGDGVLGLVHDEVSGRLHGLTGSEHVELGLLTLREAAHGTGEVLVGAGALGARARDDERGARLVDENGVDLVDDGEGVIALDALAGAQNHVVAQVVKTKFGIGTVDDIALIGVALVG